MIAWVTAAAICFFLILLPYGFHIIRRITDLSSQMEILAGGDLNYHIAAPGQDELAQLGRGIEEMRQSVLDQMTRENETVLENSRLETFGRRIAYSFWEKADEAHTVIRLATSWSTTDEDLKALDLALA